jgi:hypothetical protein
MADTQQGGTGTVSQREVLWACVGLTSLLLVCAVLLMALGKDIRDLVMFANIFALPLLGGLGAILYRKFTDVEKQVNGRMTQLIENNHKSIPLQEWKGKEE